MYNEAMSADIVLVEDELELAKILRDYLEAAGFKVRIADDGTSGLALAQQSQPDLVILDLNLPGMDGLDVARHLRRHSEVPIIMATARVDESDRLVGLELGADDYIVKPFSPKEVVARVRAVLRRTQAQPQRSEIVRALDVEIDVVRHRVQMGGEAVELTPTEFNLLLVMARQPGRVFTRLQLLQEALGETYQGYERTIDAHIKNLRSKIEQDPKSPRYVQTVFGVGYRFADE
jgi:DNA-binding response OmpR family regulator